MLILGFSSCTEVIDFELKGHEPILVIDAFLTTDSTQQVIKISESTPYFDEVLQMQVEGANVVLSNGQTNYVFNQQSPGIYASSGILTLQPGVSYSLTVTHKGKTYTATSTAKEIGAPLDAVFLTRPFDTIPVINEIDSSYQLWIARQESPSLGDYYTAKYYVNGVLENDTLRELAWTDDVFFNGQYILFPIYRVNHKRIKTGDTIDVEMLTINKAYNDFLLSTLFQTDFKGGIFDVASSNIKGNFDNKAMGFFIICDITKGYTVVP